MYNFKKLMILFLSLMPLASLSMEPPREYHCDPIKSSQATQSFRPPMNHLQNPYMQRSPSMPVHIVGHLPNTFGSDDVGDEGSDEEVDCENVLDPGGSLASLLSSLSMMQIHLIRTEQPNVPSINNNLPNAAISYGSINADEKAKPTKRSKTEDLRRVPKRQRVPTVDQSDRTLPISPNE